MYARFGIVMLVSLVVMFLLSMSMVRTWDHYLLNPSNLWMAVIMVSAMGVVMMLGMWSMYENRKANTAIVLGFAALFVGALFLGRAETFVGDKGFLTSMIPHHSRAILVCQEADLTDPEILELCEEIVSTQQEEIAQMKQILEDRY